ncbi:acyl-CoA thioesterase [Paenibacillus sp. TRM 82003]|nr:acyl-CoA thioesterase [Paenibacillus sp. TRM 82003]
MKKTEGWVGVTLRVRYQETDAMGVVYHGNYFTWFELARTEWTRANGYTYRAIEERGLLLPVVDVSAHYKQPARYDDEITVRCRPTDVSPIRLAFEYEVILTERPEHVLVTGTSKHVWVDRSWRPVRLSKEAPDLYESLKTAADACGEETELTPDA